MERPETGEFIVNVYDGYGARLKLLQDKAGSLEAAKVLGQTKVGDNEAAASFTVDRRVFNSLDSSDKF